MMRALIRGVAVVAMATSSIAVAQTRTWTNGSANLLWGDAGNWDTGIPGAGETASFGATGVGTIDLGNATRTITNLTATTAGYTFANGTLDVSGISPTNAGLTTISAQVTDQAGNGLTLNQNSGDSTGLTISGPLVIGSASATALRVSGTTSRNGTFTLGSTTLANSVVGGVSVDAALNSGTIFQGAWTIGGDMRLVRGTSNAAGATLNGTVSIGGNLVNAMAVGNAGAQITVGASSSVSVTGDLRVMNAAGANSTGITINKALTALGGNVHVYHGTLNLNVANPIPSTTQAFLLGDPTNTTPTLTSTISINTNAITLNNPVTVQSGNDAQAILTSGASGTNSANKVTYAGTITLNKNLFVDPSNTANAIIDLSGKVTGAGGLVINNTGRSGTVWLSNTSNDYSGGTTVLRSLLQINAAGALGGSGRTVTVANPATVTLGYAPAGPLQADLLGRIVSTSTGTAALNGNVSATNGEDLDFSSAGNNFTGLSLGAVGTVSYTGTLTPNGSTYRVGGGGGTLTFNPAAHDASKNLLLFGSGTGGTVDLAGASRTFDRITFSNGTTQNGSLTGTSYVADNAAAATVSANLLASGSAGLTKYGTAQLTLSGLNTYTGATTVAGGTLALQFNATNPAGVVGSAALTLGSGTLSLLGGSTAIANTQAFTSGTTLGGMATVSLTKNTATAVTLDLGTITRGNGSYLNVTTPTGTVVRASHPLDSTGTLLGTWASVGTGTSLSYATSTSATDGTISAYAAATTGTAGSLANVTSSSTNYLYAAAATLAANQTAHTLRYIGAATTTALGTNSLTLDGLMNAGSGKLTISGTAGSPGLVTGADGMLNIVTNTQSIDITSVISGTGGLTFGGPGAGTLKLTGLNTYTGKTTIVSGTVLLTGNEALRNAGVASGLGAPAGANATIDIHNGVILQVGSITPNRQTQSTDRTINLAGAGPGTVTLRFNDNDNIFALGAVTATGAGAKTLAIATGFNGNGDREEVTFNGAIGNVADGSPLSLQVTYRADTASSQVVNLVSGGTFTGSVATARVNSVAQAYLVIGGRLTSAGGNNNFTSTPGTGQLGNGSHAGDISLDTATILYYNSNSNQTLSGVISGLGSVHKAAGGVLTPSGTNTYTGVTTLTGGTLSVAALGNGGVAGNLGAATNAAANIVFNGGTLRYTGSGETSDRAFTINAGTTATIEVTSGALSLAGATGAVSNGSLSKTGPGTLTLTGASTYTGATSINAGTLILGSAQNGTTSGPLGANGTINFGGGTLQYSANTAIAITDYSPRFATGSGVPVRVDTNGRDVTFATALGSVGGSLAKFGAGTLTLGTVNTYSGSTTIAGGTLTLEANGTIASSLSIVLASGATLDVTSKFGTGLALAVNQELKGDGTAYGNFTLGNGSILTPGVTGAGALNFDGNLTLAAGSVFNFELGPDSGPGSTYDQIRLFSRFGGGMLDVGAGLINFSNFNFTPLAGFGPGTYVLFDGGFTTTFAGTLGSSLNGTIDGLDATLGQSGSNVLLTVAAAVPEPCPEALVAVAIVVAAGACRRSRRR